VAAQHVAVWLRVAVWRTYLGFAENSRLPDTLRVALSFKRSKKQPPESATAIFSSWLCDTSIATNFWPSSNGSPMSVLVRSLTPLPIAIRSVPSIRPSIIQLKQLINSYSTGISLSFFSS
jgi:hypothetical protein